MRKLENFWFSEILDDGAQRSESLQSVFEQLRQLAKEVRELEALFIALSSGDTVRCTNETLH